MDVNDRVNLTRNFFCGRNKSGRFPYSSEGYSKRLFSRQCVSFDVANVSIVPGEVIPNSLKDYRGVDAAFYVPKVAPLTFPINHVVSKGLVEADCFKGESFHVGFSDRDGSATHYEVLPKLFPRKVDDLKRKLLAVTTIASFLYFLALKEFLAWILQQRLVVVILALLSKINMHFLHFAMVQSVS
ncbi:hypothetical protein AMTR_s00018p00159390 [Amborella trichopoda]|uniref:Uncharacterized protein n=1 Tax=Amborella trichopoda TaxID=13333 RepID=W1PJL0_AMBTC|nr:hypothetical protein AMTR_s00018p00159390 [Amborella trichopoda]